MRILITGISGYIGSRLLATLSEQEWVERMVGIDVNLPPDILPKLKFYRRSVLERLDDVFLENRVDGAVHLAFVVKPTHKRDLARRVDLGGTASFLLGCERAKVRRIICLSSHTVYGAWPEYTSKLTEEVPPRPLPGFQYSWDKAEVERMFRDFARSHPEVKLTILRSCPVLGPNAQGSVATPMFRSPMIKVSGFDPLLQFVHEDDLIRLITQLLRQPVAGVFNVAGEGELKYSEVAGLLGAKILSLPAWLLSRLMGFSWALRLQEQSPPEGLKFIKYPPLVSTEKLKRETGFQFRYSSRETLLSFLQASNLIASR